jgi:hypothetical protein
MLLSIFFVLYIILIIVILVYQIKEKPYNDDKELSLNTDGFKIFNHDNINEIIETSLSKDYIFIDYLYTIKGCTISTFHRDVTSSGFIFKTKYPVYTLISYYNRGPLLTICPESHTTTPFLFQPPQIIYGNPRTSILFNCDIVHAGAINNFGEDKLAIQRKICHKDDLIKLKHLIGINKTSIGKCSNRKKNDNYIYTLRKLSLFFSFFINHVFTSFLLEKPKKDSIIEYLIDNFYIGDFYI